MEPYRIYGNEASPYSVKVRSYFRYKQIPHVWIVRRMDRMAEFNRYAKLPLVPLVVSPDESAMQDSTPILEAMETRFPEPSITPEGPVAPFISTLLEELADEWGNKAMFHYRWTYDADRASAAYRIAEELAPAAAPKSVIESMMPAVEGRMVPRLPLVGSNQANRRTIEGGFERLLAELEPHLVARPYLFGARPVLADFGMFAQLYELASDPTPGALMRERAPLTCAYVERMLEPKALGELEPWEALEPTLMPLLRDQAAGLFLPWSTANAQALARGDKLLSVELDGTTFTQEPQRYHAKSLAALKAKYTQLRNVTLDHVLDAAGARRWLES